MPITKNNETRMVAECMQCGEAFDSQMKLRDHIRRIHIEKRKEKPIVVDKAEPVAEANLTPNPAEKILAPAPVNPAPTSPIVLEYRYKGTCPTCRSEVRTIMLDVGDYFAIAYCSNCDKKLTQTKVIPIDKQFKK